MGIRRICNACVSREKQSIPITRKCLSLCTVERDYSILMENIKNHWYYLSVYMVSWCLEKTNFTNYQLYSSSTFEGFLQKLFSSPSQAGNDLTSWKDAICAELYITDLKNLCTADWPFTLKRMRSEAMYLNDAAIMWTIQRKALELSSNVHQI